MKNQKMNSVLQKGFTTTGLPRTSLHDRGLHSRGFTLPELLITMGILAILFGFVSINLIHLQRRSSLIATTDTLVSDLYSQQNKAMTLDTEGRGTSDNYGVYFETSRYILFHGPSYPPLDTSNFIINLDPSLQFASISFPASSVIFSKGSGEISGFIDGSNTVTLTDNTNGEQKILKVNRYGSLTVL